MGLDVDWERNYSESKSESWCHLDGSSLNSLHVFTTTTAVFWLFGRDRTTRTNNATTKNSPPVTTATAIGPGPVVGSEYGVRTRLSVAQNDPGVILEHIEEKEGNILLQSHPHAQS